MADRKYKYPSLKELYNYLFHKDFDNMHNSLYDVRATARMFLGIISKEELLNTVKILQFN